MRIGWSIPLPGPFRISGTVWRSKPRKGGYVRKYQVLDCGHAHRSLEAYNDCIRRHTVRR